MKKNSFDNYINNYSKYLNQDVLKKCHTLKMDINNIKQKINASEIPSSKIMDEIKDNKALIKVLEKKLKDENVNARIMEFPSSDCLEIFLCLIIIICICSTMGLIVWFFLQFLFNIPFWTVIGFGTIASIYLDLKGDDSITFYRPAYQIIMSMLPINNKYSFCKVLRKLKRLEKKYDTLENDYNEYLTYLKDLNIDNMEENNNQLNHSDGIYEEIIKVNNLVDNLEEEKIKTFYKQELLKIAKYYKDEISFTSKLNNNEFVIRNECIKQLALIEWEVNEKLKMQMQNDSITTEYNKTVKLINQSEKVLVRLRSPK